jgi:NitT/TauT family transport system permease protein/sulfonate transport system permease protein
VPEQVAVRSDLSTAPRTPASGGGIGHDGWSGPLASRAFAALVLAALGAAWFASAGRVPAYLLPPPAELGSALWALISTGQRLTHLGATLGHIGAAIAIAFAGGALLAFVAHYAHWSAPAIHQRMSPFLSAFSGIGWTLLAAIWFGVSSFTVIFTIVAVLLPFALVNLREGLAALDAEILEMGRSFGRSRLRAWWLLVLPALVPFAAATLRIMFGVAWKVTLTAELFGGGRGLGYVINVARQDYDTATIFAVILLIIAAVTLADRLIFAPLERLSTRQFGGAR